ncbi:phosphotransferase family protein [Enterococcus alishanensis]|uniref:Phosphotransferase family protein n=1 Tax=Enterococcus alishanensis TaxID=1303817 RepID=A0ABS6TFI3_9ENTE|nr:phosphotransferase family protein [Enterococcus alishanensis]MBV7391584.1 phosphotransferase family protein [Enterococcus alishanensis]
MEFQLDSDWRLQPIKGDTGKTYIGYKADERVFIKQNTTPMLAALSQEGIAPKLVWIKRTGNGDTLTAQEWLDGRLLEADEITQRNDVIDVLYHLHHSESLKTMLKKIGGQQVSPEQLLASYEADLPNELKENEFVEKVHGYLTTHLPKYPKKKYTVVHGDVNHRNWLVCRNYLYLVDWDSVMFADPALDIGTILGNYVPLSSWGTWLLRYGIQPTDANIERVYWYALMSILLEISRFYMRGEIHHMNRTILQLKRIFAGS